MLFRTLVMASLLLAMTVSFAKALTITATSQTAGLSGFSIIYDDADTNLLLDLSELVSFSGISDNFGADAYDTLLFVPEIFRISRASGTPIFGTSNFTVSGVATTGYAPSNWAYAVMETSTVPLSSSLTFALAAMGALGLLTRRRMI